MFDIHIGIHIDIHIDIHIAVKSIQYILLTLPIALEPATN